MPIEIREIIIRTEINSGYRAEKPIKQADLFTFKKQLLEECKRLIIQKSKNSHKR